MHDFTYPSNVRAEKLWRLQFGIIRPVLGALFPAWRSAFAGLPRLIEESRWVTELVRALDAAGFASVRTEELSVHGATMVSARA
jgi:demethylmenaquinone methyltransferase/2-methoxy-6-polyprenyl-1,4-benzoquinol methylase